MIFFLFDNWQAAEFCQIQVVVVMATFATLGKL
jgi:hypothetical protein